MGCWAVWFSGAGGVGFAAGADAGTARGYFRFPAVHGDTVVFTAEGDLWRVPLEGGSARRLTTHLGTESHAAISPDGSTVAFSAEYEGPVEVYTMPLAGGLPIRRTFLGGTARVAGWTPGGQVLFSTDKYSGLPNAQLVELDPVTGLQRPVPLAQAAEGAYSADGDTLYFTRLRFQGSSTKRYEGGTAQSVWRFSKGAPEAVPVSSDHKGTSSNPMWWNDRVYHVSDRDGILNLWSVKPDGTDPRQHTKHREFDVLGASLHAGRIVYQHGADLRVLDLASGGDRALSITLSTDFDQWREKWVSKPLDYLTDAHLAPKGDRVVLTARGQVFVAPVESGQGRFVEMPRGEGVRYRGGRFLPDGKSLLALSDETGELEFWRLPADGLGRPSQVTTNGTVFRFPAEASPDGQWIAFGDKDQKLWVQHLQRGTASLVAESRHDTMHDFAWSPDSRWLAYSLPASNRYSRIELYGVVDGRRSTVTSDRVDSHDPAWSPDGHWLYFLSDRELRTMVRSPWGPLQPDPFFTETTKIYQVALHRTNTLRSPFSPRDELVPDEATEKDKEKDRDKPREAGTNAVAGGAARKPAGAPAEIELEGWAGRLFEVPVPAGNYSELKVTSRHLLWISRDTSFEGKRHLRQLEITNKEPKAKTLVEDLRSFEPSADGKKVLVRKGDRFHVIAADALAPAKLEDSVDLGGWTFSLQPREEWRQIYGEAWRMLRDYFYDRGMHGVDWRAIRDKYRPLVDRVTDRGELSQVLSQMAGELSALHIYVRWGDHRDGPDDILPASLGATWSRDAAAGGWRIEHIHRADPDFPAEWGPLARPGVGIQEGDVITRINGQSTLSVPDPGALLKRQAGRQVLLEWTPRGGDASRRAVVKPLTPEQGDELRYDEWELTRRERVESRGEGRLGYVHLRAMGSENMTEWARHFYPVHDRQGLILDVRHNRGGNIDSWILGKLLRKAWFYWQGRVGDPIWNMQYAFRGHLVVLCDEFTMSDGEAFAEGFRRLGLGKVIGTRTWGGEIWLSAERWLVDRGMATAAETGVYGPEGTWLIEGHGVDPDIVVDNPPHATFEGGDAQLEAAIGHLKDLIARDPRPVPPAPRYPDKSFRPAP